MSALSAGRCATLSLRIAAGRGAAIATALLVACGHGEGDSTPDPDALTDRGDTGGDPPMSDFPSDVDGDPDSDAGAPDSADVPDTESGPRCPHVVFELDETACALPEGADGTAFGECSSGSGNFGRWIRDESGLPAYRYLLDPEHDPIAAWSLSDGSVRTDHLFQIGNDRIIGVANTEGYLSVFARDRGPVFLNRIDPDGDRLGGGFSYLADDAELWATPWAMRPCGARVERVYGMNYVVQETEWNGLLVRHALSTPPGSESYVIDDVAITNTGAESRRVRHYEYWDVNRHPLELQLVRSGRLFPSAPSTGDRSRDAINAHFRLSVIPDEVHAGAVRVRHEWAGEGEAPAPETPNARDYFPDDIFLARLVPDPVALPVRVHTDRTSWFGGDDSLSPATARLGADPAPMMFAVSAAGEPAQLAEEIALDLEPGETVHLRYAYGFVGADESLSTLDRWARVPGDVARQSAEESVAVAPRVVAASAPWLLREMAWHAVQLLGATAYEEYFDARTIVQGSAYMYLHGLDGAARDFGLFAVPVAYMRPDIAGDLLRSMMRMTWARDFQISYAVQGFGKVETAGIHTSPSDLDLFFLWALSEYIAATGDQAFLDDMNEYWPIGEIPAESTREHARRAFRHLVDDVGLGEHGLIRMRTGDWSDGISMEASNRTEAVEIGESIPNTQMAAWVLPLAARLFDGVDDSLAGEMRAYAEQMRAAADSQWVGQWYRRAWFGPDEPFGDGHLDLEAQIWALISDIPEPARRATLIDAIYNDVDSTSPVGATLTRGNQVWHAITGLLTWGYALHDPQRAWGSYTRNTMHSYANENPDQWFGIWSGPDGIWPRGGTWASEVTPMTDWPVMNANQHAMPLIATLRMAGVEPAPEGDGLRIAPRVAELPFVADFPLLRVEVIDGGFDAEYRALTTGTTALYVPWTGAGSVLLNGREVPEDDGDGWARIPLAFEPGSRFRIAVRTME